MSERPRTRCPTCERAIEPDATDVVEAVEIVPVPGFGEGVADTAEAGGPRSIRPASPMAISGSRRL